MVLKRVIGLVFAGALAFSAMAGEIVVRIAPPRMVIEKRGPPTQPQPCVDFGISQLGWPTLRVGRRKVGTATAGACPMGSPSLGSQTRRLCSGRGALELGPLHGRLPMPVDGAAGMGPGNSQTQAASGNNDSVCSHGDVAVPSAAAMRKRDRSRPAEWNPFRPIPVWIIRPS